MLIKLNDRFFRQKAWFLLFLDKILFKLGLIDQNKCMGCQEELFEAFYMQELGYYVATSLERLGPYESPHYGVMIVNDKGELLVS